MCCNGALFDWVRATPEERAALPAAAFTEQGDEKGPGFQHPCPLLDGNLCSAYAVRPGGCRKFECNLLRAHKSGSVTREHALGIIASAKQLLGEVRAVLHPGESLPAARARWRHWFAAQAAETPGDPPDSAFILRMTMLNRFLDRHFRKDSKKQMMEVEAD
jgi:hypothetical protein